MYMQVKSSSNNCCFMHSQQTQCSLILMDSLMAANKMNVISMWSGGGMVSLLTSGWREMEMDG